MGGARHHRFLVHAIRAVSLLTHPGGEHQYVDQSHCRILKLTTIKLPRGLTNYGVLDVAKKLRFNVVHANATYLW